MTRGARLLAKSDAGEGMQEEACPVASYVALVGDISGWAGIDLWQAPLGELLNVQATGGLTS